MSQPRMIESFCLEICQRTLRGEHRFLQTKELQDMITYDLGHVCTTTETEVHAGVFMATHYHLMVTVKTMLSVAAFTRELNSLLARTTNRSQDEIGQFWCREAPQVTPVPPDQVYDRMGYILGNPTSAGVAVTSSEHAGVIFGPADIGRTFVAKRPDHALGKGTELPLEAKLTVTAPKLLIGEEPVEEFQAKVAQLVEEHEAKVLAEFKRAGKTPPSKHTMEQRIAERWERREWKYVAPDEDEKARERISKGGPPRFFAKGAEAVQREERRQAKFQALYRAAMREYHDDPFAVVEFPHGTLLMSGDPRVVVSAERIEV